MRRSAPSHRKRNARSATSTSFEIAAASVFGSKRDFVPTRHLRGSRHAMFVYILTPVIHISCFIIYRCS